VNVQKIGTILEFCYLYFGEFIAKLRHPPSIAANADGLKFAYLWDHVFKTNLIEQKLFEMLS
jgi:hypothetical protein